MLPEILQNTINNAEDIKRLSQNLVKKEHLIILARGINYSIAKEAALKLKETCYINANGYPAGEFMHGHMAILDKKFSVLVLDFADNDLLFANVSKLKNNSESSFYGIVLNSTKTDMYEDVIHLPRLSSEIISPFVFATCSQIISFFGS